MSRHSFESIYHHPSLIIGKISLLSLVVIILELIVFLKSDFLNHQSPSTFTSNLKTNNRLPLNLFQKIAAVGIGEDMPMGRMIDSSVYSLEISNVFYSWNEKTMGFDLTRKIKKETHSCTSDDFKEFGSNFESSVFGNSVCLAKEDNNISLVIAYDDSTVNANERRNGVNFDMAGFLTNNN